ncbi:MAG: DUF4430 domain-containing protein [Candidatus Levyibacteriota bacterium]
MKKIFRPRFYLKKVLPYGIILIALVFAGSTAYAFSPKPQSESYASKKVQSEKGAVHLKIIPSPTSEAVLGMKTINNDPSQTIKEKIVVTPTINPNPVSSPRTQNSETEPNKITYKQASSVNNTTQLPVTTATPLPTPQLANTVSLQIQDPAGTSSFTVTLKAGANVCDVLQETIDEGKITSVTFDDSYMSTLHSKYVTEINGFKNNWTFTINGTTPLGCSLANPKPNDTIVWKFG